MRRHTPEEAPFVPPRGGTGGTGGVQAKSSGVCWLRGRTPRTPLLWVLRAYCATFPEHYLRRVQGGTRVITVRIPNEQWVFAYPPWGGYRGGTGGVQGGWFGWIGQFGGIERCAP